MTGGWNRCRWTRATLTSCARRNSPGVPAPRRRAKATPSVPAAEVVPCGPASDRVPLAHRVGAGGDRVIPLGADRAGQRAARILARLEQVKHVAEVIYR